MWEERELGYEPWEKREFEMEERVWDERIVCGRVVWVWDERIEFEFEMKVCGRFENSVQVWILC